MHTVRIVKSDAHLAYAIFDDGRLAYSSGNPVYRQEDTIPIQSDWSAEEVAVLAGLDGGEWIKLKAGFNKWADSQPFGERDFHTYLRSHIQAEIKRQEGKDE